MSGVATVQPAGTPLVDAAANLRRAAIVAAVLGIASIVVLSLAGHPLMGIFVCLGLAFGAGNNWLLQRTVQRYRRRASKPPKAKFTSRVFLRLGAITLVAVGIALLDPPGRAGDLRRPRRLPDRDAGRRRRAGLPRPEADRYEPTALSGPAARAITIEVGEHIEWHVFGVTLNGDTITSTLIAGAILIGLGLWVRFKVSVGKPSGSAAVLRDGDRRGQRPGRREPGHQDRAVRGAVGDDAVPAHPVRELARDRPDRASSGIRAAAGLRRQLHLCARRRS